MSEQAVEQNRADKPGTGKKLVLVDAYSLLFRAFFAGRYLSTSDNRPTGALFGFTSMLLTILNNEKPDAIVVCWDAPHRTLRSQEFADYKAHRPDTDPQLIQQQPIAREIVVAFGIQAAELPGYEADDLIGTLSVQGREQGYAVVIVSGDSDTLQLVNDDVRVQITQKGVTEVKTYDADAVRERYGIGPECIADYKALTGDTSDNIPGVPGIGDKTASALLQKFGSLANVLDHIPDVTPPKARAALEANVEQARFSKRLATIICDAPLNLPLTPYAPTEDDWKRVRELFARLEFKSMLLRLPRPDLTNAGLRKSMAANGNGEGEDDEGGLDEYGDSGPANVFTTLGITIQSAGELEDAIAAARKTGTAAIRLDTDGGTAMHSKLRGIAFAPSAEVAYYVAVRPNPPAPLLVSNLRFSPAIPNTHRFARREGGAKPGTLHADSELERTENGKSELAGSDLDSASLPTDSNKAGFAESTSELPQSGSTSSLAPPSRRSEASEIGIAGENRRFDTSSGAGGLGRSPQSSLFDEPASEAEPEADARPVPAQTPGDEYVPAGFAVAPDALRPLLEDAAIAKIGYNVKPAEMLLERLGLRPTPFVFDILIAAYLLDAGRSSYPLTDIAASALDTQLEHADPFDPGANLAEEAALLVALVAPLRQKLADVGMTRIMDEVEMPLIPVLSAMERAGLAVNVDHLATLGERMGRQMDEIAGRIYELAGEKFNIGSTKQLQEVLFEKLQLPTGKKIKTGYSTGADVLEQLAGEHEIARRIIEYREVSKLKVTYADALIRLINPDTGRIHTSLNQTVTTTGRLSSSEPNLQNVPVRSEVGREIRQAFIAPPGKVLLSCDYSQVELRLLAHVTKDPTLVQAFSADEDIHKATAATVFGVPLEEVTSDQRRQAKTINFAVIYGQSGFALAATLGVGAGVATNWIKEYFERLPGVKQYVDETAKLAHRQKWVQTLMGRRRYVPELDSGNAQARQAAERAAVNMPIQGTAADIIKLAMVEVQKYLHETCGETCTLLLQVHDELLFEVDAAMIPIVTPEIVRRMESAFPIDVPLRADAKFGLTWADMTPIPRS